MKRLKSLRSSLGKAIAISIAVGLVIVVALSNFILAFYIIKCDDEQLTIIEKYLDEEPEESIRGGY